MMSTECVIVEIVGDRHLGPELYRKLHMIYNK